MLTFDAVIGAVSLVGAFGISGALCISSIVRKQILNFGGIAVQHQSLRFAAVP